MSIEDAVGPIIVLAFILGLLIESFWPRESQPRIRLWRPLGVAFFFVSAGINIFLPLLIPAQWIATHSLLPGMRLGIAGGFALGFFVWSFVYYWYHRSEHRFDLMWRCQHQLHHSPRRMDAAGFAVAHPFDMTAQTLLQFGVLIGVLGIHPAAAALVGLYGALAELIQHLNVRTPRWLEWIVQRPEAHQRHHEFGQHAGNYGDWPVWDKLLGTYRAPADAQLPYGFAEQASRRIGAMLLCLDVNRAEAPIVRHD
jgi:sterol desaturase/sphingolipid hydroxylase (fatty acid hydroxylase superfamily)